MLFLLTHVHDFLKFLYLLHPPSPSLIISIVSQLLHLVPPFPLFLLPFALSKTVLCIPKTCCKILLTFKFSYIFLSAIIRLQLFRYNLNQIPYDSTVAVRKRFKGLDLIECLMNYGRTFVTLYRRQGSTIPMGKKCKKQIGCLTRPYK